jgi:hypothetical protein
MALMVDRLGRLYEFWHASNERRIERLEMKLFGEECDAVAACLGVQGMGRVVLLESFGLV